MTLFFAYHNKLVVMDPTGKTVREVTNASEASGLDFHLKRKVIVFTDTDTRKIYKLKMPKVLTFFDTIFFVRKYDLTVFESIWLYLIQSMYEWAPLFFQIMSAKRAALIVFYHESKKEHKNNFSRKLLFVATI